MKQGPVPASALAVAFLSLVTVVQGQLPSDRPSAHFPVPNGAVYTLAARGGTLYAGGIFDRVGQATGPLAVLGTTSFELRPGQPPVIHGEVMDVVSDGQGGWFVAGALDQVGPERRQGVVHVLADGSLAAWNPGVRGSVSALCRAGDTLYLGGPFDIAGGLQRGLAAVDTSTGALLPWNPLSGTGLGGSDHVAVLVRTGGLVLVGGYFPEATFGGIPRAHLAFVDALTGALLPDGPTCNGFVWDALVGQEGVLLAGNFTQVAGQPRTRLAWLTPSGALGPAFPVPNGDVTCLALAGSTLYLGGNFSQLGGLPRAHLAAVALPGLGLLPWAPEIAGTGGATSVDDLELVDGQLLVAGSFLSAAGAARRSLVALDPLSGAVLAQDARLGGVPGSERVRTLAHADGALAAGGNFLLAKAVRRNGLAAFDLDSGELLPWAPDAGATQAFAFAGERLYIGGTFTHVNGVLRPRLAALDLASGALLPGFDAQYCSNTGAPFALACDGARVFVGGNCMVRCGENCRNLDALDAFTGQRLAGWETRSGGVVRSLLLSPEADTLYLAGSFTELGSDSDGYLARDDLGALDVLTGAVLPWDPSPNLGDASALLGRDASLLAAGTFQSLGGGHKHVAELDLLVGTPTAWEANVVASGSSGIDELAGNDSTVFLSGTFASVGGMPHANLAAVDARTGAPLDWGPLPRDGATALLWTKLGLVVGGGARYRLGVVPNLCLFEAPSHLVRAR